MGLYCLPRPIFPKTRGFTIVLIEKVHGFKHLDNIACGQL